MTHHSDEAVVFRSCAHASVLGNPASFTGVLDFCRFCPVLRRHVDNIVFESVTMTTGNRLPSHHYIFNFSLEQLNILVEGSIVITKVVELTHRVDAVKTSYLVC